MHIYICMCVRMYTFTHVHTLSKFSSKIWRILHCFVVMNEACLFPCPSLSFSPPYLTSSQAPPLPQPSPHRGDSFEVEE